MQFLRGFQLLGRLRVYAGLGISVPIQAKAIVSSTINNRDTSNPLRLVDEAQLEFGLFRNDRPSKFYDQPLASKIHPSAMGSVGIEASFRTFNAIGIKSDFRYIRSFYYPINQDFCLHSFAAYIRFNPFRWNKQSKIVSSK